MGVWYTLCTTTVLPPETNAEKLWDVQGAGSGPRPLGAAAATAAGVCGDGVCGVQ